MRDGEVFVSFIFSLMVVSMVCACFSVNLRQAFKSGLRFWSFSFSFEVYSPTLCLNLTKQFNFTKWR